ncbi:MAG: D-aminoacylase [Clostridia bacterium]|nr:D-aminoacylase [Clostridia bacterium]
MQRINRRDFLIYGTGTLATMLTLTGCLPKDIKTQAYVSEVNMPNIDFLECDYLIHKGLIIDGTNSQPFEGDIAIKGDRIIKIARSIAGKNCEIIDARGKIVSPGFIDIHTHTEDYMVHNGRSEMMLLQGVTAQIGGNCGNSKVKIGSVLDNLNGMGINYGMFSGYREIRRSVVGNANLRPNGAQMQAMLDMLQENLQAGAFGFSVALEYWPQSFATTDEIVELSYLLAEYGGFLSVHVRDEGDRVIPAVEEIIEIGFRAKVPVQYSHIKAAHRKNWGKMEKILELLSEARDSGLDIKADVYGYNFSSNDLGDSSYCSISDEDLEMALTHPQVMIASDSGLKVNGAAIHPRAYGNYPRIIAQYARNKSLLSIETLIHKMTAMPASRLGLADRGRLLEGYKADIAVFDLNNINDEATRQQTTLYSKGVQSVFVNGNLAVNNGIVTGTPTGEVLRNSTKG